jgi:hypothetical protein
MTIFTFNVQDLMIKPIFLSLMLFATTAVACLAQPAVLVTGPPLPGLMKGGVAWGDYDGDGLQDLVISGYDSLGVANALVLHNSGSSLDIDTAQHLMQVSLGDAAWADMDGDGDQDLVLTGETGPRHGVTLIYRNIGGVLTLASVPNLPGLSMGRVRWADLDGDGDRDIFLTGFNEMAGFKGIIARNDGGGNFTAISNPLFATREWTAVDVADYDGDGLPDIAFCDISPLLTEGMRSVVLHNDGGLHFSSVASDVPGLHGGSLDFGDLDGDGKLELAATGSGQSLHAGIYKFVGGQFVSSVALPDVIGDGEAIWLDYDNDGDPDLIAAGRSNAGLETRVYRNNGGLLAVLQGPALMPALTHVHIAGADWNGDGYRDFVVSGQGTDGKPWAYLATWSNSLQTFKF